MLDCPYGFASVYFLAVHVRYSLFSSEVHGDVLLPIPAWWFGAVVAVFDAKVLVLTSLIELRMGQDKEP